MILNWISIIRFSFLEYRNKRYKISFYENYFQSQFLMIFWKQKNILGRKNWTWLNGNGPKRGILTLLEAMAHPVYCTIHISVVYSCAHAYHKHLNFKNYQILSKKCQIFKKIMKFHTNNEILENFDEIIQIQNSNISENSA